MLIATGTEKFGHGRQDYQERGFRLLAKVPRLPGAIIDRLVEHFGGLQKLLAASVDEETTSGDEAYAKFPRPVPARPDGWEKLPWA